MLDTPMSSHSADLRFIAFYLPQYHVTPENNQWWGEGFTDWVNVKKALPLFEGHYQPRIPAAGNYYDLTDLAAIRWQIELAQSYGIHGFCHYHYWFEGKQLLQTPTDLFISSPELDHPFCLAWANATWSRAWDGDENAAQVLIQQTHIPDRRRWQSHFDYLLKAWKDKRAITVDGKPVFLIYRPHTIEQIGEMLAFWREQAVLHDLPGLHFVAMQQHRFLSESFLNHFDAVVEFQPSVAMFVPQKKESILTRVWVQQYLRSLPGWLQKPLRKLQKTIPASPRFHDYEDLWERIIASEPNTDLVTYSGAFMDWDNTPRYGNRARIVRGGSPERFKHWLRRLTEKVRRRPPSERLIFINAWNEWAEGTYLEPDERHGLKYLEAVKSCLS